MSIPSSRSRVVVYWIWFTLPLALGLLWVGRPWSVLMLHGMSGLILLRGWRGAVGTALRPAILWAIVAHEFLTVAYCLDAGVLGASRPGVAGSLLYLSALSGLAALVSVLNARRPGAGAWGWLMVMMVVVFQIPRLEAHGLDLGAILVSPPRLEMPWTLFAGVLIVAGAGNYLGTALTIRAVVLGWLLYECLVTTTSPSCGDSRLVILAGVVGPLVIVSSVLRVPGPRRHVLERLWIWFRDRWGVVWAMRVKERFNREAEVAGWSYRLGWNGVAGGGASEAELEAGAVVLRGLLRRFAEGWRLDEVMGRSIKTGTGASEDLGASPRFDRAGEG